VSTEGVTPGPWQFIDDLSYEFAVQAPCGRLLYCVSRSADEFAEGDGRLIAEAGTVLHETGKTPRQLADEVDALKRRASDWANNADSGAMVCVLLQTYRASFFGYHREQEKQASKAIFLAFQQAEERAEAAEQKYAGLADEVERLTRERNALRGPTMREAVATALAEALGDAMDCMRVWDAWRVGTMTQDDFAIIRDDSERLYELADAAISALAEQQQAAGGQQ